MKRSKFVTWSELKVGMLVVVCLALFTVAVLTLGGRTGVFEPTYTLYTFMPSVSGLQRGAPVRLAGVGVGDVQQVQFIDNTIRDSLESRLLTAYGDSLGDRAVVVRFDVERSVREKITRASRVKIGTVGLLGDKYLDLDVGDPREPVLEEGDIVLNEAPIDYEGLLARAAEGVDELVSSLENTRQLVARINAGEGTLGRLINDPELYEEWLELSRNGAELLAKVQSGEGTLPALLNDRQLYDQIVSTTADLEALTREIRTGDGSFGRIIRDPELYERLVTTIREGEDLITALKAGEGTAAKLVNDPTLYERLDRFVIQAQGLMDDIQKNPRKYINLQIF